MSGDTILNGRYRLYTHQGSGGMAVIYRAIDEALGREVAVKILRPSLTADPAFIMRFQNEARSIANLSHPNIVTVHDVGNDGAANYIVMEYVKGKDLKQVIKKQGALPVERALNLAIGICAGLGFAHRAGIVHADVKPQNILLTENDIVKITDFGIAQALSDTQPVQKQSVVWGSPHYFAPEQAQGEKPSAASDVYSIGIVMFEMLTGRLPYNGVDQQELALAHIRSPIPNPREFNPAVPEALAGIVMKAMSKNPNDRYSKADQLGHVLIAYRDNRQNGTMNAPQMRNLEQPLSQPRQPIPPPPNVGVPHNVLREGYPLPQDRSESVPTQPYNVVPEAPNAVNYGRPAQAPASVPPSDSRPLNPPRIGQIGPDSRPYNVPPMRSEPRQELQVSSLDAVTIALAVLAFTAVACLIPLYIVVWQARF